MSVSMEEFGQLQAQMMEIKAGKYASDEKVKKLEAELHLTKEKFSQVEAEFGKANKVIEKSKKMKDLQTVSKQYEEELEILRGQNSALRDNLNEVVKANDALSSAPKANPQAQAEQQKLISKQAQEIASLKEGLSKAQDELTKMEAKCLKLIQKQQSGDASSSEGSEEATKILKNLEDRNQELKLANEKLEQENVFQQEEKNKMVVTLQSQTAELEQLRDQVSHFDEKAKKKQVALLALQQEMHAMDTKHKEAIAKLTASKQEEIDKLAKELEAVQCEKVSLETAQHHSLEASSHGINSLKDDNAKLLKETEALKVKLVAAEEAAKKAEGELLGVQLEIANQKNSSEEARLGLAAAQSQHSEALRVAHEKIAELEKVASSRKGALDSLSKEKEDLVGSHRDALSKADARHQTELQELREMLGKEITALKNANTGHLQKIEELKANVKKLGKSEVEAEQRAKEDQEKAQQEIARLSDEVEKLRLSLGEKKDEMQRLLKDRDEREVERALYDKKRNSEIRDYQRQLRLERLRVHKLEVEAEDLRRQLNNALRDGGGISRPSHRRTDSMQSSNLHGSQENLADPMVTSNEYVEMIHKISHLQQERDEMQDRVYLLESTMSNLRDEVRQKGEMIRHLVDHGFTASTHDASAQAALKKQPKLDPVQLQMTNKKLQELLEKTLGENMALSKKLTEAKSSRSRENLSQTTDM